MICPKCQNPMRTYDRQGIHIDQCERCRGIFLDRGELEQIANAEQHHYGPPPMHGGSHNSDSPPPMRGGGGYRDSPRPHGGGHGGGHNQDSPRPYGGGGRGGGHNQDSPRPYGQQRRKKSFLEGLFD